jgi:hypothetical protein
VGLVDHPLERPLFAAIAPVIWFINIHFWKPVSTCERWDPLQTSFPFAVVSGFVGVKKEKRDKERSLFHYILDTLLILGLNLFVAHARPCFWDS